MKMEKDIEDETLIKGEKLHERKMEKCGIYKIKNKLHKLDFEGEEFILKNYFMNNYNFCDYKEKYKNEDEKKDISNESYNKSLRKTIIENNENKQNANADNLSDNKSIEHMKLEKNGEILINDNYKMEQNSISCDTISIKDKKITTNILEYEDIFFFQLILKEIIKENKDIKYKINFLEFYNFFLNLKKCKVIGLIPYTEQHDEEHSDSIVLQFINLLLHERNHLIELSDLTKNYIKNKSKIHRKQERKRRKYKYYYGISLIEKLNYIINNKVNIYDENNNLIDHYFLINIFPCGKLNSCSYIFGNMIFAYNYIYFKKENLLFASVDYYDSFDHTVHNSYFGLKQYNYVNKERDSVVNFVDYFHEYIFSSNIYYQNIFKKNNSNENVNDNKLDETFQKMKDNKKKEFSKNNETNKLSQDFFLGTSNISKMNKINENNENKSKCDVFNNYKILQDLYNKLLKEDGEIVVPSYLQHKNKNTYENINSDNKTITSDIFEKLPKHHFLLHYIDQKKTNECGNFNIQELKNQRDYMFYKIYSFLFCISDFVFYIQKTVVSFHSSVDFFFEKFLKFTYKYGSHFNNKKSKAELHFVYIDEDTQNIIGKYSKYDNKINMKTTRSGEKNKKNRNSSNEYIYKESDSNSANEFLTNNDTYYSDDCEKILLNYAYKNYDIVEKKKVKKIENVIENNILANIQKNNLFCYQGNLVTIVLSKDFQKNNSYKYFEEDKKIRLEYFPFFKYNICKYQKKKKKKKKKNLKYCFCSKNNFTCSYCLKKKSSSLYAEVFNNIYYNDKYDITNFNYIHPTFSLDLFNKKIFRLIYKNENFFSDHSSSCSDVENMQNSLNDEYFTFNYSYSENHSCCNDNITNNNIYIFINRYNDTSSNMNNNYNNYDNSKVIDDNNKSKNVNKINKELTKNYKKFSTPVSNSKKENNIKILYNSFFYKWAIRNQPFNSLINDLIVYISLYDILYKYKSLENKKFEVNVRNAAFATPDSFPSMSYDYLVNCKKPKNTEIHKVISLNNVQEKSDHIKIVNISNGVSLDNGKNCENNIIEKEGKNIMDKLHILNEKNLLVHNNKGEKDLRKNIIPNDVNFIFITDSEKDNNYNDHIDNNDPNDYSNNNNNSNTNYCNNNNIDNNNIDNSSKDSKDDYNTNNCKKKNHEVILLFNYNDAHNLNYVENDIDFLKNKNMKETNYNYSVAHQYIDYSKMVEYISYVLHKCYISLPNYLKKHELIYNLLDIIEIFLIFLLNKGFFISCEHELFLNTVKNFHPSIYFSLNKAKEIIDRYFIDNKCVGFLKNALIFLFMEHLILKEKREKNCNINEYKVFICRFRNKSISNSAYLNKLENDKNKSNNKSENVFCEENFSIPFEENFMSSFMSALKFNYHENLKLLKIKSEKIFADVPVVKYNFRNHEKYKEFVDKKFKTNSCEILFKLQNDFSLYLCNEDLLNTCNKRSSNLFRNFINNHYYLQRYQLKNKPNMYLYFNLEYECYYGCRFFKYYYAPENYFHKDNEHHIKENNEFIQKIIELKKDIAYKEDQLSNLQKLNINALNINSESKNNENNYFFKTCNNNSIEFIGNYVFICSLPVFDICPTHINNINQNDSSNYFIKNSSAQLSRIWIYSPVIKNISLRLKICIPLPLTQLYKMKKKLENNEFFEFEKCDLNEEQFVYMYLTLSEISVPQRTLGLLILPFFFYVCAKKLLHEVKNLFNENTKNSNSMDENCSLFYFNTLKKNVYNNFHISINIFDDSNLSYENVELFDNVNEDQLSTHSKNIPNNEENKTNLTSKKNSNLQKYVILPYAHFYSDINALNNYRISIEFTDIEI